MIQRYSPFKLTTHFRGWSRVLAGGLVLSMALNFLQAWANIRQSANLSTPRIVMKAPHGMVLPVAASAFVWTPEVAADYVKMFLPILYTFTPMGTPPAETWSPFIHPDLLKAADERFQKNHGRIQLDGLHQTLRVREVRYDPDSETAEVSAELRLMSKNGEMTRTPINLSVELTTTSDPLNPYGHEIINVR